LPGVFDQTRQGSRIHTIMSWEISDAEIHNSQSLGFSCVTVAGS
jgi:hypothetical protein